MSSSFTLSATDTFTITHAKHLASKVATDLKRMQRFYGSPSDEKIAQFEEELIELLKANCLEEVTYGFKKNNNWIEPALRYKAKDLYGMGSDDDPGRVPPGMDISGASFASFLTYNSNWFMLSNAEQIAIEAKFTLKRGTGTAPTVLNGFFVDDKTYTSGGRSLGRATIRKY
jgi:hypothetical protein